jgi:hypothetical protein
MTDRTPTEYGTGPKVLTKSFAFKDGIYYIEINGKKYQYSSLEEVPPQFRKIFEREFQRAGMRPGMTFTMHKSFYSGQAINIGDKSYNRIEDITDPHERELLMALQKFASSDPTKRLPPVRSKQVETDFFSDRNRNGIIDLDSKSVDQKHIKEIPSAGKKSSAKPYFCPDCRFYVKGKKSFFGKLKCDICGTKVYM